MTETGTAKPRLVVPLNTSTESTVPSVSDEVIVKVTTSVKSAVEDPNAAIETLGAKPCVTLTTASSE